MNIYQPISLTGDTTLNARTHSGTLLKLNKAAGLAITLPAATGSGARYELLVETAVSSNTTTIKVANSSDVMTGTATNGQDSADTVVQYTTTSTTDTITMDGSTTGGSKGDRVILIDASANLWFVQVIGTASGTEATPFSATV